MASQIFPDVEELMDILFAELPADVYPEDRADDPDPDNRSYSSAELRAHMQVLDNVYANLMLVYADKFLTTVTPGGLASWEKLLFTSAQDATQTPASRKQNLLAKYRATGSIALPAIRTIVAAILDPMGIAFDILPYSGQSNGQFPGAWVLDKSELGQSTYLAMLDPIIGTRTDSGFVPLTCAGNYAAAGLTAEEYAEIQATAYTYEVRIYGTVDDATLALIDRQLTAAEPARSTHFIRNGASNAEDPSQDWTPQYLPWWQN